MTGDLDLCREVLTNKLSKKTKGHEMIRLLHNGGEDIFTSNSAFWNHSRKHVAPAFSSNHVKRMNKVVIKETLKLIKRLDVLADEKESFDIGEEMIHLTLCVISDAAFEYPITLEERNLLLEEVDIVLQETRKSRIPFRWRFGAFIPEVKRAREGGRKLEAFGLKILDEYRKLPSPQKGTVIDLIANNKEYKNDKERANDIIILFLGGHDTTGFTLAWTLLELARHKDEQRKLQEALRSIPESDRTKAVALQCVIKEGMRLRPVSPLGSVREIKHDIVVEKNEENGVTEDLFIPSGSAVICSQMLLNRNPRYFKDPDEFKPSRWLNPSEEALASLMPFSLGRRNCVGQSLAKAEVVNVLLMLCARYDFSIDKEGTSGFSHTHQIFGARLFVSHVVL